MSDKYGFAEKFSNATMDELIAAFNSDVGNQGWVNARMHFLSALKNEFLSRDVDCTAFISSDTMSMRSRIHLKGDWIVLAE